MLLLKKYVYETVRNVFTPFFIRAHTPDDRYMLSYLIGHCSSSKYCLSEVNLFQFSYLKRKGSHIKNLSDAIEGFYFFLSYSMVKSPHEDKTPFDRK